MLGTSLEDAMRIIGWRMLCASLDGATRVIDRMLRAYYRTIWLATVTKWVDVNLVGKAS